MWTIKWGDHVWGEADLTVGHMAAIVTVQGIDSWEQCNPLGGPVRLMGVLAVLLAVAEDRAVDDVIKELAVRPAADLLNAISTV